MEFPQKDSRASLIKVNLYEFIGTFFISLTVNISHGKHFNIGLIYFILILIAKDVSGAHFNPAISLAIYLFEGRWISNIKWLLSYNVMQYSGAFLGCRFAQYLVHDENERFQIS
jgi:glycerol uptake facilitator-like aquaporin